MPEIKFTISTANAAIIRKALAHHQSVELSEITIIDFKDWLKGHVRVLVRNYRESQRDANNPVDESDVIS